MDGTKSGKYNYLSLYLVITISILAFIVRFIPLSSMDFPISDGGMFYVMSQELRSEAYHLPRTTSYNNSDIPFIYPPMGIFLPAILADLFGVPLLKILQFLPLVITTLTIPLFYNFSKKILNSMVRATYATIVYALMPATFSWTIMGGGVPRSLGLLFAILTLHQAYLMYTKENRVHLVTTAICAACATLSHPIATWVSAYSIILLFIFFSRSKKGLFYSILVVLLALIIISPWLITVFQYHGPSPFLNAGQTGHQDFFVLIDLLHFDFSEELFFRAIGVIGFVGLFASVKQKNFFLPVWLIINPLIQPRGVETFIVIPLAMACSLGLADVILPGLGRRQPTEPLPTPNLNSQFELSIQGPIQKAFMALLFWEMIINAFLGAYDLTRYSIGLYDRQAMQWVAGSAHQESRFLVLTGSSHPLLDPVAEWFPALAQRQSLTTIQGQEWKETGPWIELINESIALQGCVNYKVECILDRAVNLPFTHLYVRKNSAFSASIPYEATNVLVEALSSSPDFELVYSNPGVSIFASAQTDQMGLSPAR